MTVAPAAHTLTAEATLKQLRQFGGALFLLNPCTTRRSRCVYLAPAAIALLNSVNEAEAIQLLESEYALEVEALPSFVAPGVYGELQRNAEWLPSDSYICHGSTSQGSGRAVFKGQHQLKGVGRTRHVGHHDFFHDINGALSLREAATEAAVASKLARVLATPPIPIDFLLVPEQGKHALILHPDSHETRDIRCIMGRRGSPLRAGHLDYLTAALRTKNENKVGSFLVHLLLSHTSGVPASGIGQALLATFEIMMQRAIRLSAESLVYSLHVSYWPDNFDLFSRPFDVGETRFHFPALLANVEDIVRPDPGETPTRYFGRLKLSHKTDYSHTLFPIRNVFSAMRMIAREVNVAPSALDERYTWEWLHASHRLEVMCAIAKVLGLPESEVRESADLRDILAPIADEFPLFPRDASEPASRFSWERLITDFERTRPPEDTGSSAILEQGRAFRKLIAADAHRAMLDDLHAALARHVIDPYLRDGLEGISHTGGTKWASGSPQVKRGFRRTRQSGKLLVDEPYRVDGYVSDIPYVSAFHRYFSPATTDAVLLAGRVPPPRAKGLRTPFTYVDLGCGDGVGLAMLAATHPEGRFIGIDASRTHVNRGRKLARQWGLTNFELRHETFAESTLSVDADYVVAQGVLAWVSRENQTALLNLADRLLKPGGAFSVGYNCVPGWIERTRLQRFLRIMADTLPGPSSERFRNALDMARSTEAVSYATVSAIDAELKSANANYHAHEYLNQHWQPLWPGTVLAAIESRGLSHVSDAQERGLPDEFRFSAAQLRKLNRIDGLYDREDAGAIFRNTGFRVDVFVKGAGRRLSTARHRELSLNSWWMAQYATNYPGLGFDAAGGELPADKRAARAIMDALFNAPSQLRTLTAFTAETLVSAAEALFAQHYIAPAEPLAVVPAGAAVNSWLDAESSRTRKAINARVGEHGILAPTDEPEDKRKGWFELNRVAR